MTGNSLRKRAYQHIQAKILSGELPAGSRLSEQALAAEIGISRTPVRSAIRELEAEGLLEQLPRYGTIVKKADRRDLSELYDMRVALEGFAAEVAAEAITEPDLGVLRSLCRQMDDLIAEQRRLDSPIEDPQVIAQFVDADRQFHLILLRATGNRRLMKNVADSRMLSQWCHYARMQHDLENLAGAWDCHRLILQALESADVDKSRQAMVHHIRFGKELALKAFDRFQAEGDAAELLQWTGSTALQG